MIRSVMGNDSDGIVWGEGKDIDIDGGVAESRCRLIGSVARGESGSSSSSIRCHALGFRETDLRTILRAKLDSAFGV